MPKISPYLPLSAATIVVLSVLTAGNSWAAMYKCAEGGTVTYSDKPCGAAAEAITVKPAAGNYNAREGRRREAQTIREIEIQREQDRISAENEARKDRLRALAPTKEDPCDRMKREHDRSKDLASRYRYQENIQFEQDRMKKLEHDSFFECDRSRRIGAD